MRIDVKQILRPIRLMFLVKPNNKESFLRALTICSSIWGGKFFPIIPFYKKFTKKIRINTGIFFDTHADFYLNTIENFDPDYIVYDDALDLRFINRINKNRQLVPLTSLESSIVSNQFKYGIPIINIVKYLGTTEFKYQRIDNLHIHLPTHASKNLFFSALFGNVNAKYIQELKSLSHIDRYCTFETINKNNYHTFLGLDVLEYFKIGEWSLQRLGNPFWTGQLAVLITDGCLNDMIKYWNLRALGWSIIAILPDEYNSEHYKTILTEQQLAKSKSYDSNIRLFKGTNIEDKLIEDVVEYLNAAELGTMKYMYFWWYPRYWMKMQDLTHDNAASIILQARTQVFSYDLEDSFFSSSLLQPEFGTENINPDFPAFVNEIQYEIDDSIFK